MVKTQDTASVPFPNQCMKCQSVSAKKLTFKSCLIQIVRFFLQDELKKLYAQLEVYKRKKMLANNPHLQKKRNSKKGLGRSLMKRITEIPETMHIHRQCSREDGSEHGSNRSTLRRNPFESSHHGKIMVPPVNCIE